MIDFVLSRRFVASIFVLTAVTILAIHPTWARSIGADVWNVPALQEQLRANTEENSRLSDCDETIRQRIAVKDAIIHDLLANRITLADATERFTILNASRPDYMTAIRERYPAETERESVARNVIAFAVVRTPKANRDAVVQRLEADLRQMLTGSAAR